MTTAKHHKSDGSRGPTHSHVLLARGILCANQHRAHFQSLFFLAASLPWAHISGQPIRIEEIPTNAPVLAIYWKCDGPAFPKPRSVIRIWADGLAIWSTNLQSGAAPPYQVGSGGPPYLQGWIEQKKVSDLIQKLRAKGYFDNEKITRRGLVPVDGCYWSVLVLNDDKKLTLRSAFDFRKVPLDTLADYEDSPGSLRQFIEAWNFTVAAIQALIPPSGAVANFPESEVPK